MPDAGLSREEFKRQFAEAIGKRDAGDPSAAVRQLESLLPHGDRIATLTGTIGTMLFTDMNAPDRAIPYLQWTVIVAPRSKLASLTFCRALTATGQLQRAIDEARRYLGVAESEEHRGVLASLGGGVGRPNDPVSGAARLPVVLLIETSRIVDPYATVNAGLIKLRNRLRTVDGALDRLDFYVATFAGRVWSLGRLDAVIDGVGNQNPGSARWSGVNLERHGLVSALTEAVDRVGGETRSPGERRLPAWLMMLTAGEIGADGEDIAAEVKAVLNPLRVDPGLKLLRVLIGDDNRKDTLRGLTGADAFRLRETGIDAFFSWLARNLEAALRESGTGASIRLTPPDWAAAA